MIFNQAGSGERWAAVDQYLERKFSGENKMHSCDISDCFSILGIFNQRKHIPGNVEMAMTHMNSASAYPRGSISLKKM